MKTPTLHEKAEEAAVYERWVERVERLARGKGKPVIYLTATLTSEARDE